MERIRRFFYNNKGDIFKIIGIVATVIILIQLLNQVAKRKNEETRKEKQSIDYGRDISQTSGEKKNSRTYEEEKTILETFAYYCNEKDYEPAYSLLSQDCKDILFPTLDQFKYKYCNLNFDVPKTCGFQVWSGDTYKVEIRDDIMSSGKYIKERYNEDFYTIVEGKLNIAKLIKRTKYENTESDGEFRVRVDSKDVFKDYTIVNISAINKSNKVALLDPLLSDKNIYATDNNGVNYYFSVSEITQSDVIVKPGEVKQIPLKFYTTSRENLELVGLTIGKMIENYDKYIQKSNYAYKEARINL